MSRWNRLVAGCAAAVVVGSSAVPASAVIIGPGDGTLNRLPASPPSGVLWQNVGAFSNGAGPASLTYLGNRYVLMANHTGLPVGSSIFFPGVAGSFALDGLTDSRLKNPDNSLSDLRLVRLSTDPGLSPVPLPTAGVSPAIGANLTLIGNGRTRVAAPTYYDVTAGPTYTATANGATAAVGGFAWTSSNALAWGTNTNDGNNAGGPNALLGGVFNVFAFQADFYESGPTTDPTAAKNDYRNRVVTLGQTTPEAAATQGDSGGGVFGPGGVLVGTLTAVDSFTNQPADTTLFGVKTYISDLSVYRSQLPADVPEPASALAFAAAAAGLLAGRRRSRRGPQGRAETRGQ
jgi:hypothetical protein